MKRPRARALRALVPCLLVAWATAALADERGDAPIAPQIHPSKEGSSGVFHVRSAFTFPNPGAAFEGNDHFFGSSEFYSPDRQEIRLVETRDSLTVNIAEGLDFNAASIFRSTSGHFTSTKSPGFQVPSKAGGSGP